MEQQDQSNRRPLAVRSLSITKRISVWLAQKNITPNQISLLSIAVAALGLLVAIVHHNSPSILWLFVFPITIQLRLLCNLFDGMVAVEGGKQSPAGELFNDAPDRIADLMFILGAGFIAQNEYALHLAWLAAALAIMTAYIRVLGVSMGCQADFRGPMAKQHRMALLTFTSLIMAAAQAFDYFWPASLYLMDSALVVITLGCVATCWRRLAQIYRIKNEFALTEADDE